MPNVLRFCCQNFHGVPLQVAIAQQLAKSFTQDPSILEVVGHFSSDVILNPISKRYYKLKA